MKFFEEPGRKGNETNEPLPECLLEDDKAESTRRFADFEVPPTLEGVDEQSNDEENDGQVVKRRRGRPRIERTGTRGRPRKVYRYAIEEENTTDVAEEAYLSEVPMRQAMNSAEADEWYNAMVLEIKSIIKNNTWQLVERPKDREIVGSRIVLRNKFAADGRLERKKARFVAQGFSQRPGIHFKETFAPVARLSTIRLLTSLAIQFGMSIRQFDVTCAYLNGELEEEIFMKSPKYLSQLLEIIQTEEDNEVDSKARQMLKELCEGSKVCLLNKSLYGLRQAGRSWHAKLDSELKAFGAKPTNADPYLYQIGGKNDLTLIAIYVDNIIVASRNLSIIGQLTNHHSRKF